VTPTPDSVVAKATDDHLPRRTIASTLMRLSWTNPSAALHADKDLAVSPAWLPKRLFPKEFLSLSIRTSLLAPRMLPWTGVTRYRTPNKSGRVRTFLPIK